MFDTKKGKLFHGHFKIKIAVKQNQVRIVFNTKVVSKPIKTNMPICVT